MSILDPSYNCDLHFSDLVTIKSNHWNESFFELSKLSDIQLRSHMIDGTFESVWNELYAVVTDETRWVAEMKTRFENIADILYKAIVPYLKQDPPHSTHLAHLYIPDYYERVDGSRTFQIWDDIQREYIFDMSFLIKS